MTFPKAVFDGPLCFGGFGFKHLYVASNVNKIQSLICHRNNNTSLGETMKINLNWVQLLSGISTPVLQYKKKLDYIHKHWFG
jgi:hypothetical protein